MVIYTQRLLIRDYTINDRDNLLNLYSDNDVMFYVPSMFTEDGEKVYKQLKDIIYDASLSLRKHYYFILENRSTNLYIGNIGYTVIGDSQIGKVIDIGYFIFKEFWNRGYITESLKEVIKFAFEENNVACIYAGCYCANIGSERVMQKCGFIKEEDYNKVQLHDGEMKKRVKYKLIKQDYEAINNP